MATAAGRPRPSPKLVKVEPINDIEQRRNDLLRIPAEVLLDAIEEAIDAYAVGNPAGWMPDEDSPLCERADAAIHMAVHEVVHAFPEAEA